MPRLLIVAALLSVASAAMAQTTDPEHADAAAAWLAREAALDLTRDERRQIQTRLAAHGFDPGPIHGVFGRQTRAAIRAWQAARGEEQTGYLDADAAIALLDLGTAPSDEPVVLSSGWYHTCGLRADGAAVCWGGHSIDQVTAISVVTSKGEADFGQATPPADQRFVSISSGWYHTCGLRADGAAVCWGSDFHGQATPPADQRLVSISSGSAHTCGLRADGAAVCWGGKGEADLGQTTPPADQRFVSISSGGVHTCGLRADGAAVCWGGKGEFDRGQATPPADQRFVSISSGSLHTCGLRADGAAVCWGGKGEADLGQTTPPADQRFVSISSGGVHTCGLRADGAAVCWGGKGEDHGQATPPADQRFVSISSGSAHTCGLRADGAAVCWGYNRHGQATPPADQRFAVGAPDVSRGRRVDAGAIGPADDHSDTRSAATELTASAAGHIEHGGDVDYFRIDIAEPADVTIHTTGSLDTVGTLQRETAGGDVERIGSDNDGGEDHNFRFEREMEAGTYYVTVEGYADSAIGSYTVHLQVTEIEPPLSLSMSDEPVVLSSGLFHTCGLRADGAAVCWGGKGEFDGGQATPPVDQRFVSISSGLFHTCGLRADGAAVCWGGKREDHGQATPPADQRFVSISSGPFHTCGLRADGAAVCWGGKGEADHGQATPPADQRFVSISSGPFHTCGLRADGAAVCWGGKGEFDRGQATPPAGQRFVSISSGEAHTCGLRADGAAVCWGSDRYGQATPPADQRFVSISSGGGHTCGQRADGAAVCWGGKGEADHGQTTPPADQRFVSISSGGGHTCGQRADGAAVCWGGKGEDHGQATPPADQRFAVGAPDVSRPADDHSDTRSAATELTASAAGHIEHGGDVDYFRIDIAEPAAVTIHTTGSLDTVGTLQRETAGGDVERIGSDDDGGEDHNFRLEREMEAGTYYVTVEGYADSAIGSYTVHLQVTEIEPPLSLSMSDEPVVLSSGIDHTCGLRADGAAVCWGSDRYGQATPPADQRFVSISSGEAHTCGLRADGAAVCWGVKEEDHGQATPPADQRFVSISSGSHHTCGLRADGAAVCWGSDRYGKATPPAGQRFVSISSGWFHTCGLRADGAAVCWGYGSNGRATPPADQRLVSISSGPYHTCGLRADGAAVCWGGKGEADFGQATPPADQRFVSISSGGGHTCGLRADGAAVCWGSDFHGQATPPADQRFVSISSGGGHTCGLRADGAAVCWGGKGEVDLGQATPPADQRFAVGAPDVSRGRRVDAGAIGPADDHSDTRSAATELTASAAGHIEHGGDVDYFRIDIAEPADVTIHTTGSLDTVGTLQRETAGGDVERIGSDNDGGEDRNFRLEREMEAGTYYVTVEGYADSAIGSYTVHLQVTEIEPPLSLSMSDEPVVLSSGWYHTCGLRADGAAVCWGSDGGGKATPPAGQRFVSISSGEYHTCGLRADGAAVCWGGKGEDHGQATPPADQRFVSISSGSLHTCGLRADGAAVCWGGKGEDHGQATPPADQRFVSISSGSLHTCGLRADGAAVCWGSDFHGQATPPAGQRFVSISSGRAHTCGLRADGAAVCWGSDGGGRATPPADQRFVSISSSLHTCGLRADGAAVCWGPDFHGQATPPAGQRFVSISSGSLHTCGLRADGAAVCWGHDGHGQATPPADQRFAVGAPDVSRPADDHSDTRSAATELTASAAGHIEHGGDVDYFRIDIAEPAGVTIHTTGSLDTVGTLQRETAGGDVERIGSDNDGGEDRNFRFEREMEAGTYYVTVEGYADSAIGSYTESPSAGYADSAIGSYTVHLQVTEIEPPLSLSMSDEPVVLSSGIDHTCGLRADGAAVCWGSDRYGQATPPADQRFVSISSGEAHTCGLHADGAAVCWGGKGEADRGQATPPAGQRFVSISSGMAHTCGLRADGAAVCWGGKGEDHGQTTPPAGQRFVSISSGSAHTCGLRADGAAVCWGYDAYGQATPPADQRFVSISSGSYHTCGLRADGAAVCWGSDDGGEATPPAGQQFVSISSGSYHTCGLRADGAAVCWGYDFYGQATPPADRRFVSISSGRAHTCGLRADGAAVCWGGKGEADRGQTTPPADQRFAVGAPDVSRPDTDDPDGTSSDSHAGSTAPADHRDNAQGAATERVPPAAEPLAKVTGPRPDDTASNVRPDTHLEWSPAAGATRYHLSIGTDRFPDSDEYRGTVAVPSYDLGPLEYDTTYYWRIDAENAAGEVMQGDVWYFTTSPPPACKVRAGIPVDGLEIDITDDVSLVWTTACHATGYNVYFGTNPTPDSSQYWGVVVETRYGVGNLEPATTYYWRIDAENAAGETSGDVWSFSTPLPPPGAMSTYRPANKATDVSIDTELRWSAVPHATSYVIYWGRLWVEFYLRAETTETTYDPGPLEYDTTYLWRVDAKNESGVTRPARRWEFTTESEPPPDRPTGERPAHGAVNVSPSVRLSWSGATGATSYRVYLGTDPEPDSNPWPFNEYRGEQKDTSYAPERLANSTTYYWRVDTQNAAGEVTTGDVWEFTTALARAADPRPADEAANVNTTADLRWSAVPGAEAYAVYFGSDSTPDASEFRRDVSEPRFDPGPLEHGQTYYWRIDAKNESGETTGGVWQFRTCDTFSIELSCMF